MGKEARVSVITPTIGTSELREAVASVQAQTVQVQHIVVVDGEGYLPAVQAVLSNMPQPQLMILPENTGANGFNGHRIYASLPHITNAEYVLFLDEDNWFDPVHVARLLELVQNENLDFAYALRKVVSKTGDFLCLDNCESLGKWPAFHGRSHLVDTSAYLFRREWLINHCHLWNTDDWHVDRNFFMHCSQLPDVRFACNGEYSLNYRLGGTERSVKLEFFQRGNALMAQRFSGNFPWSKQGQQGAQSKVVEPSEAKDSNYRLDDLLIFAGLQQDAYRQDAALLSKPDRQSVAVLPPLISEQLQRLQLLLPLKQHQRMLRELYGRSAIELESLLPDLRRAGMVTQGAELYQTVVGEPPQQRGQTTDWMLGLASADRPKMVERLLLSLLPYVREISPQPELVFVDDSRDPENALLNEKLLSVFASESNLQVFYYDRTSRKQLVNLLARRQPELSASLHWLLDPMTHPQSSGTYGVGKNLLSLLAVGKKLLMLDDDCLLKPWRRGDSKPGVCLNSQIGEFATYDSLAEVMEVARAAEVNPLQEHLDVLGRPLGEVFQERNIDPHNANLWIGLSAEELADLSARAPISMTTNTIIGAQNSRHMDMLFTLGRSGERVEPYLKRSVGVTKKPQVSWRISESDCIHPETAFLCTTLSGLAATELPAFCNPVGRSEDLFLGELTRYLTYSSRHYRFAWGLVHEPYPERSWNPWEAQDNIRLDSIFLYRAMIRCCESECHFKLPDQRYAYMLNRFEGLLLNPDTWIFSECVKFRARQSRILRQNLQASAHLPHYEAALKRQISIADRALGGVKSETEFLISAWRREAPAFLNAIRNWPEIVSLFRQRDLPVVMRRIK